MSVVMNLVDESSAEARVGVCVRFGGGERTLGLWAEGGDVDK